MFGADALDRLETPPNPGRLGGKVDVMATAQTAFVSVHRRSAAKAGGVEQVLTENAAGMGRA